MVTMTVKGDPKDMAGFIELLGNVGMATGLESIMLERGDERYRIDMPPPSPDEIKIMLEKHENKNS